MDICRICGVKSNLKYTPQEIRKTLRREKSKKDTIHPITKGNICKTCEVHLIHFDDEDLFSLNGEIIVEDDDALLSNMFNEFDKKLKSKKNGCIKNKSEFENNLTRSSLGSDGEVIEIQSSRESTPSCCLVSGSNSTLSSTDSGNSSMFKNCNYEKDEKKDKKYKAKIIENLPNENVILISSDSEQDDKTCKAETNVLHNMDNGFDQEDMSMTCKSSEASTEKVTSSPEKLPRKIKESLIDHVAKNKYYKKKSPNKAKCTHTPKCDTCEKIVPDLKSLRIHNSTPCSFKCPECEKNYTSSINLVQHMRRKHRLYDGEMLVEKSRGPRDSAMTIRLLYDRKTMYYECQLCGRIETVFQEHLSHILREHPSESKSLKDPMMRQIKCPICKERTNKNYLSLCKHILKQHTSDEYQAHLKLVKNSARREANAYNSANVYQFVNFKNKYFFECKTCKTISGGYLNHKLHMNCHKEKTQTKTTKLKLKQLKGQGQNKVEQPNAQMISQKPIKQKMPKNNYVTKNSSTEIANKVRKRTLSKGKIKHIAARFKCSHCDMDFNQYIDMNFHKMRKHSNDEFNHCSDYDKRLTQKRSLLQHLKEHQGSPKRSRKSSKKCNSVDENYNTDCQHKKIL
ncbi:zinc finger protein 572-like [Teleopsis dalmanni]|uniref:zinc finger protein 572-like n=1 Tax=Teleopsis dalmanni TaxID=139649 RepID=UPI0018CDE749|nr:zinc finger protein 572-like [Teleopsis dalmanni]